MLWWFAQTTLIAGGLAAIAALVGRWKRLGPEARHVLWLVVLIKLALPPVVAWPWELPDAWPARVEPAKVLAPLPSEVALPTPPVEEDAGPTTEIKGSPEPMAPLESPTVAALPPSPEEVLRSSEVAASSEPIEISRIPDQKSEIPDFKSEILNLKSEISPARSRIWPWQSALLAVWLAGSIVVVIRRGIKIIRFHRSLARSQPAPGWLVEEAREIGEAVGVRPPPLLATPGIGTPLLWCLGRPRLVLPESLIKRLDADRWSGILAHELAHLARLDHWVVRLELVVEAVWWWNPLFWHARRRLHEEAELACDARVVRSLPDRRFAYAEALVDVCEHIARAAIPSPSLGVGGAGASHSLEGRLLMILGDTIPRRPSRRATLAALLLASLALPAWTLGQQPDDPKPKVETPPKAETTPAVTPPQEPSPKVEAPPQTPSTEPSPITIDEIVAARTHEWPNFGNLSFRYVVAGRDQSHNDAYNYGNRGGGQAALENIGPKIIRRKSIQVQVADVVFDLQGHSRIDVIEARPASEGATPGTLAWDRRFIGIDGAGSTAFEMAGDKQGSVPFRWLGANIRQTGWGDSLALAFQNGSRPGSRDKETDPLDPRPANILDLYGGTVLLLSTNSGKPTNYTQCEVVGRETIDGIETVRVAWIAKSAQGLRGLCWFAPKLDFAVVRLEATIDGGQLTSVQPLVGPVNAGSFGRRIWRKRASDFVEVGNLWLPRKVSYEESEADPAGGEPLHRLEQEIRFEDFRVEPKAVADTFRPKLEVEALDEASGNFTAKPPALAPGMVERLKQAVQESKFGPPVDEKTTEEAKKVADARGTNQRPAIDAHQSQIERFLVKRIEKKLGFNEDTKVPAPIRAQVVREFLAVPGVVTLRKTLVEVMEKLVAIEDKSNPNPDPAVEAATRRKESLLADFDRAWEMKSKAIRVRIAFEPIRITDEWSPEELMIENEVMGNPQLAQQLEPVKAAERKLADVVSASNGTNSPALIQARGELESARAKFLSDQATLRAAIKNRIAAVKDMLAQPKPGDANRPQDPTGVQGSRPNDTKPDPGVVVKLLPGDDPIPVKDPAGQADLDKMIERRFKADPEVIELARQMAGAQKKLDDVTRLTGTPGDPALVSAQRKVDALKEQYDKLWEAKSQAFREDGKLQENLAQARDEVELFQFRRNGKAAEVKKAEAQLELANQELSYTQTLADKQGVSQKEVGLYKARQKAAEAELERKKAELDEAELLLKQAKRRTAPSPTTTQPASTPASVDAGVLQFRRNARAAEVQKAEAARDQAALERNYTQRLRDKGGVGNEELALSEGKVKIAEAEVLNKKAELDEADLLLNQAKGRTSPAQPPAILASVDANVLQFRRNARAAEVQKAEAARDKAMNERDYTQRLVDKGQVSKQELALYEGKLKIAEAEVLSKKAELDEAEFLLKQATVPIQASNSEPKATKGSAGASPATLADLRDDIEVMEAQLQVKKAELRGVEAKLVPVQARVDRYKKATDQGSVIQDNVVLDAETALKTGQTELEAKKAEVVEFELRVKQVKRRAEVEEARLKREVARAKARLEFSQSQYESAKISYRELMDDRTKYDELMFQLDPKYIPAAPSTEPATKP